MFKNIRIVLLVCLMLSGFLVFVPNKAHAECGVYHIVLSGQNLFRISLRYGVSVNSIATANGITNTWKIYAGDELYIPCAGDTTAMTTTTTATAAGSSSASSVATSPNLFVVPSTQTVDCSGFYATSPLDGFKDGVETFYWDPPYDEPFINEYQVVILDDQDRRIAAYTTIGGIFTLRGDVSFNAIGGRSRFSWFVVAIAHGVEACFSQLTTVNRQWNPFAGLSPG